MQIRRVVMGGNDTEKPSVLSDSTVEPVTASLLPGVRIFRVWEQDRPTLPVTDASAGDPDSTFFPSPGGVRFGFLSVPPGIDYIPAPDADLQAAAVEMEAKLPGAAATFSTERPGDHTTETVDYLVVLSGSGILRAPGVEVRVTAGDCLIQNGTAHAWFNDGDEPFVLAFALVGAGEQIESA
ncbi:cupin domain-containing protein [Mycolicibacterium thermoresistibile]